MTDNDTRRRKIDEKLSAMDRSEIVDRIIYLEDQCSKLGDCLESVFSFFEDLSKSGGKLEADLKKALLP